MWNPGNLNVSLPVELEVKLLELSHLLVNQSRARVIVPAQRPSSGHWFGGGNMIAAADGALYVAGRYRNSGDSRTGVGAGERGLELAVFRSTDGGESFEKAWTWSKAELSLAECPVVSIEGSALLQTDAGVELYVSTEKDHVGYPPGYEAYLKPGTGVWSIDRLAAPRLEDLSAAKIEPFLASREPEYVHVKDPFVTRLRDRTLVLFCSHPFCWSSSNTGYVDRERRSEPVYEFFARGPAWDVAMTRGTCVLDVPRIGPFADRQVSLMFYDGGECVRNLDEHRQAVSRPRGYSCEELGGVAYFVDGDFSTLRRLSRNFPAFVSPFGTGCSRYVDVLPTDDHFYVTWQQSQRDFSQPLVLNRVDREEVERLLRTA